MRALVIPLDRAGHINNSAGVAKKLTDCGHEVVFAVPGTCHWLVKQYDGIFKVLFYKDPDTNDDEDVQAKWGGYMHKMSVAFKMTPLEQLDVIEVGGNRSFIRFAKLVATVLDELLDKVTPDIVLLDSLTYVPAVAACGIPWVFIYSPNPLRAYRHLGAPPHFSGYAMNEDPARCDEYRSRRIEVMKNLKKEYAEWLAERGFTIDSEQDIVSPNLNIYTYPSDIDYLEFSGVPEGWHRLDHAMRPVEETAVGIDENFLKSGEKVIFFSLGSMGGADVDLMRRLIGFLSKSRHRFVISKGPFHDRIDLAPNMVGGKYLNQLKLLPLVDMVINHGGNNTFVETLYFGKPMIVMPLFGDQHDNGRRAEDKKIGKCLYPNKVTEKELLEAIDEMLKDDELIERVAKIGKNMRNSKSGEELCVKLLKIVQKGGCT